MANSWPREPLEDLVDEILDRRGLTPIKLSSGFESHGHRVISAKLIKSGRIDLAADEPRFVDQPTYKRWMSSPLQADDVILTSEAPLGETAYISETLEWCLGQRLFGIRTRKDRLSGRFLYYAFQHGTVRSDLLSRATGTTAQGIRQSELRRVLIPVPPLSEQRAIAHILGTLDDKIELNRQMNATLDEIARTLFTSWFVNFDPVRAKAEGHQPEGMDAETAALFPDRLVDSDLGLIPEGWVWSTVGQEFYVTMGQSPPGSTYNESQEGTPFYQGRSDFGFRFPSERVYCTAPTRMAGRGDTLISVRAPVGDANITLRDCAIGRGVAALRHTSGSASFTFHSVVALGDNLAQFNSEGTVFGSINQRNLKALPAVRPPEAIIDHFHRCVVPFDSLVESNTLESQTLAKLRDMLLPELLSGRVQAPVAAELASVAK